MKKRDQKKPRVVHPKYCTLNNRNIPTSVRSSSLEDIRSSYFSEQHHVSSSESILPPTGRCTTKIRVTTTNVPCRNHTALRTHGRPSSSRMVRSDRRFGRPSQPRNIFHQSIHKRSTSARKMNRPDKSRPIAVLAASSYDESSSTVIDKYELKKSRRNRKDPKQPQMTSRIMYR